ncbi:MAG: hypothetical protein EB107_08720, partial [Proteobacteria bacterium]|nr:hypothetical protein [Pseudomonadota bacterium]
ARQAALNRFVALKVLHPKYASVDDLTKIATEKNLPAWQALWGDAGNMEGAIAFWFKNPELPTLLPWRVTVPAPADPCVLERNPFYWQVDTEGNQLPYIDKIEHAFFESLDVVNLWVAQGKIDMQMRHISAGSYVFLKENEAKGKYRVLNWRSASTQAYFPNQNDDGRELVLGSNLLPDQGVGVGTDVLVLVDVFVPEHHVVSSDRRPVGPLQALPQGEDVL